MKHFAIIFLFMITGILQICHAQVDISNAADCATAIKIDATDTFGPTTAPSGYGNILEFSNNPKTSLYHFEEEHNTVWYKFMALYDGYLVFDIIPLSPNDDYDFLLFKYRSSRTFCNDIINKNILPERSNIGRNDFSIGGITGLKLDREHHFKDAGQGDSYSAALRVQKGEIYYLVLDNVYDNGKGHSIVFNYLNDDGSSAVYHEISGIIFDQNTQQRLEAEVVLEDARTGDVIARTKTDSITGEFVFKMPLDFDINKTYTISVSSGGYFFSDYEIVPANDRGRKKAYTVNKLEAGKSYDIRNIYFYPNSPQFIPSSVIVIKKLLALLEDNPNMLIEIGGHIDGCGSNADAIKVLSEARAKNVKRYMTDRDIDEKRIKTIGYGCSRMIFPEAVTEEERQMNRRVEVRIIRY